MTKLNRRLLRAGVNGGRVDSGAEDYKGGRIRLQIFKRALEQRLQLAEWCMPPSSFDDVLYMPGGGTPYNDGGGVPYAVMTNDLPGQGPADVLGNQFFELGTLLLGDGGGQVQGVQTDLQLSQIVDQVPAYVPMSPIS